MSSSSSEQKKGGDWEYKLYFDPESNDATGTKYDNIKDEDLKTELKRLIGEDEEIEYVWAYKVPLSKYQLSMFLFYHMFIVFKTNKWFWSIEKHSDVITIQRSWSKYAVKETFKQEDRLDGRKKMGDDYSCISVHSLIDWLYRKDALDKEYHYLKNNCQQFATAVFKHVASGAVIYRRSAIDCS